MNICSAPQPTIHPQQVGLLIIDEIHLLGADRGPILEVIVSRMRYIAAQVRAVIECMRHTCSYFESICRRCRRGPQEAQQRCKCQQRAPANLLPQVYLPSSSRGSILFRRRRATSGLWACPLPWPMLRTWPTGWVSPDR